MATIKLEANASNWSEVTNATNYGSEFVTPNGKKFKLICHKRAHYTWQDEPKEGAQAEVKILWEGETKETTITAHKLKSLVGVEKSQKGETKTRKPFGQKLEELYNDCKELDKVQTLERFLLTLEECPKYLQNAFEAEAKRLKEAEAKRLKEEEDREFERLLKARGYSLKDLKAKKSK